MLPVRSSNPTLSRPNPVERVSYRELSAREFIIHLLFNNNSYACSCFIYLSTSQSCYPYLSTNPFDSNCCWIHGQARDNLTWRTEVISSCFVTVHDFFSPVLASPSHAFSSQSSKNLPAHSTASLTAAVIGIKDRGSPRPDLNRLSILSSGLDTLILAKTGFHSLGFEAPLASLSCT